MADGSLSGSEAPTREGSGRMSDNGGESQQPAELSVLLRAAARGEDSAWRTLMDLYGRRVFALAKSRFGRAELAEEITQSVFVTVATKLSSGQYTEQGRFEPWLFRVTMNRIRDEARRAKHRAIATDPSMLTAASDNSGRAEGPRRSSAGELDRLRQAMGHLSDSDREMVELRHHGGLSFKQIADLLEEPMGTLLARHHRALKKLKDLMSERETDESMTREVM